MMWVENRFALAFGALYFAAGSACLIGAASRLADGSGAAQPEVHAQGRIVAQYHAVAAEGGRVPYVDYAFTLPDQRRIEVSQPVRRHEWPMLQPGTPVDVAYSPRDPESSSLLHGVGIPRATLAFVGIAGACFVLTGMALFTEIIVPCGPHKQRRSAISS